MEKVDFTFRRGGRTKVVTSNQAIILQRAGLGTYQTRDMARQPMVTSPMQAVPALTDEPSPQPPAPGPGVTEDSTAADDGLGALDKDQLHALAKERGIRVHHMAGADKVRAALRDVQE